MRNLAIVLLFVGMALAGCSSTSSDSNAAQAGDDAGALKVSSDTGGIRGVVVTPGIVPVPNARISLPNQPEVLSGKTGLFTFTGLKPGDYFVSVTKPGYTSVQQAVTVRAGVAEPDVVKVVIEQIPGKQPYNEYLRFDGLYECGFSAGQTGRHFITDQCDMGVRTAYDAFNETTGVPPGMPRNVEHNVNTMFVDIAPSVEAVVQEAFWDDRNIPKMMINLDATPIDNGCDCSHDYLTVSMSNPTYGRLDNASVIQGQHVAIRGFLDWETVSTAQNLKFTIITSLFHNYVPDKAWKFADREKFPLE